MNAPCPVHMQARERARAGVLGEDAMKEAILHLSRSPQAPSRARSCQRGFPLPSGYEAGTLPKFDWNAETLEVNYSQYLSYFDWRIRLLTVDVHHQFMKYKNTVFFPMLTSGFTYFNRFYNGDAEWLPSVYSRSAYCAFLLFSSAVYRALAHLKSRFHIWSAGTISKVQSRTSFDCFLVDFFQEKTTPERVLVDIALSRRM